MVQCHIFHTLYLANVNKYAEEGLDFLCGDYEFLCWIYCLSGAGGMQIYMMTGTC